MGLILELQKQEEVQIVRCLGNIKTQQEMYALFCQVKELGTSGSTKIVLDLNETGFISIPGYNLLIDCVNGKVAREVRIKLATADKRANHVLRVGGHLLATDVFDSLKGAVESLL